MNLPYVYTQDTDNIFAMDNQTVQKIPTPPQQSVALTPLAGQRRKRLADAYDDEKTGDNGCSH